MDVKLKGLANWLFKWIKTVVVIFVRWVLTRFRRLSRTKTVPTSVNYHLTRQCNYKCGFCFHTAKSSHVLPIEEAQRGLKLLKQAGMEKINFSGGEPFIEQQGHYLGQLVRYCKSELLVDSVSIVSNGSLITRHWLRQYGQFVDILAISCDSFDPETNRRIGRGSSRKSHLESMLNVRQWCSEYQIAFKINTVVCSANVEEDMSHNILLLNPVRWKVFQCLLIDGENEGAGALRNAESWTVSDSQFEDFLQRHSHVSCIVAESNQKMRNSYLILDEDMRFLNCTAGNKKPSPSILDVGVEAAIRHSGFDEPMFLQRGGRYAWSKADMKLDW